MTKRALIVEMSRQDGPYLARLRFDKGYHVFCIVLATMIVEMVKASLARHAAQAASV